MVKLIISLSMDVLKIQGSGDIDANMRLLEQKTQAKISALTAEANLKFHVLANMLVKGVIYVRL